MAGESEQGGQGGTGTGDGGQGAGGGEAGVIKMTQAELNQRLAENKRQLRSELQASQAKAQAFDALQAQVSDLLQSGLIDGVEDLAGFREATAKTIESFKTEKQQYEEQQKKNAKALEIAKKAAKEATTKYETATIARALVDAASPKTVSAGATELIQMKLANFAQVNADGSVSVKMTVKDDDGKPVEKLISPKEAVELLESDVTNFGTLFKSTVNSGSGGGQTVDGVKRTPEGTVDFSDMTFEKYMELSKKDPGLLQRSVERIQR